MVNMVFVMRNEARKKREDEPEHASLVACLSETAKLIRSLHDDAELCHRQEERASG